MIILSEVEKQEELKEKKLIEDARWDRFCGYLIRYIDNVNCPYIQIDYEVEIDESVETQMDFIREFWKAKSIDDFPEWLKKIAISFIEYGGKTLDDDISEWSGNK